MNNAVGTSHVSTRELRWKGVRWKDDEGISLPETLVGAAVAIVVFGAIMPLLWIAFAQHGGQSDRVSALDRDRVAFDDITRLIRGAKSVVPLDATPGADPSLPIEAGKLELITGDPARDPVLIDCAVPADESGRYVCRVSEADGTSKPLIEGITDPAPFGVDPARSFVSVSMQMSPPGASRPVSLEGGVSLRAADVG